MPRPKPRDVHSHLHQRAAAPRPNPRTPAAVLLIAILGGGCAGGGEKDGQHAGTAAMAARLQQLIEGTDPEQNTYASDLRAEHYLALVEEADEASRAELEPVLARELLRAGRTEEALALYEELAARTGAGGFRSMVALSLLRLAEQRNCLAHHNADSCLVPIRGGGIHVQPEPARRAAGLLEELLAEQPDQLGLRWLLALAHMTLGEYPEAAPPEWRIPPEVFASEAELARFPDRAGELGLAVLGLAGGCATEDFDGDGDVDVFCSSWRLGDPLHYLRNEGARGFVDASAETGLEGITGGLNLIHADYDGDGRPDLLLLRGAWLGFPPATAGGRHPNSLLRNEGSGRFRDVTDEAGVLSYHPTQTAVFTDVDVDGDLDLFLGNESYQAAVHPCELFLNDGRGSFKERAAEAGVDFTGMVKGVAAGDYDGDGLPDLYLSRLDGLNTLARNATPRDALPGRRVAFVDATAEAGVGPPGSSFPTWFFDYDNDGWLDLFVGGYGLSWSTSVAHVAADYLGLPVSAGRPRLYRNLGDGTFADVTGEQGLDRVLFAMGANFGDVDNDGWLDLYLGTGDPNLTSLMPNRMFRSDAGARFQDVTTAGGFGHVQKGHAISFADVDSDGDQDVYAVMGGAYPGDAYPNALFENPGNGNDWITLALEGTESNRSAIGAHVRVRVHPVRAGGEVRAIHRWVGTGGSFGSSTLQQEIGLGPGAERVEVDVRWPGRRAWESFGELAPNRRHRLREGEGVPR